LVGGINVSEECGTFTFSNVFLRGIGTYLTTRLRIPDDSNFQSLNTCNMLVYTANVDSFWDPSASDIAIKENIFSG
jgi:hypothetical protein